MDACFEPKVIAIPIATVNNSFQNPTVFWRVTKPSVSLYLTVGLAFRGPNAQTWAPGARWSVTPMIPADLTGPETLVRTLTQFNSTSPLPDAFETASGCKLFEMNCDLFGTGSPVFTGTGTIYAAATWEPAPGTRITARELCQMYAGCSIALKGRLGVF